MRVTNVRHKTLGNFDNIGLILKAIGSSTAKKNCTIIEKVNPCLKKPDSKAGAQPDPFGCSGCFSIYLKQFCSIFWKANVIG